MAYKAFLLLDHWVLDVVIDGTSRKSLGGISTHNLEIYP